MKKYKDDEFNMPIDYVFKEDVSKDKPGLHLLYVKTAVTHLVLIDGILKDLSNLSNINVNELQTSIWNERLNLIFGNKAYFDAVEIIWDIQRIKSKFCQHTPNPATMERIG